MSYKDKPQIKLYKYENNSFVLQAIIDDFQEVSYEHNIYEAGTFTITINYNIPNALLFQRGLFCQFRNNPYDFGEIYSIQDTIGQDGKGSQIRTITGRDARYILKRRVIKNMNSNGLWAMTDKGEIVLRNLIKDQCGSGAETKRQLPISNTIPASADAKGKEYSASENFTNLYEVCKTIATQSEIGWRMAFDGTLTLEVFEGADLSQTVRFDTNFESLANGEFSDSSDSYSNAIYIGGKGQNDDRDIYEGEDGTPEGLDRFEAWDNQSSMTTETEYEAEALSMLTQYGQTLTMSGNGLAKCPYVFREQYDIGDTVTVAFSGKSAKAQILSITEHWTWGAYDISFSFGKPQNNLADQLQLMLRKIQEASNKTNSTDSVRWYTIPTDSAMPKADVTYNTIGFVGTCASGGSTFTLYIDNEKTGAKTYHVYFKQLGGTGKLTLTTGVSGATNLVMNVGTYVAIIYVDENGNVRVGASTPTNTIASGNNQPATSEAVANYKTDTVASGSDVPVTSNAVAEYSTDKQTTQKFGLENLFIYPYVIAIQGGLSITIKNNNSVVVNGTSTGQAQINIVVYNNELVLSAGTYIMCGCPAGGTEETYYFSAYNRNVQGTYRLLGRDIGNGLIFTVNENTRLSAEISIRTGVTVNNLVFNPVLYKVNVSPNNARKICAYEAQQLIAQGHITILPTEGTYRYFLIKNTDYTSTNGILENRYSNQLWLHKNYGVNQARKMYTAGYGFGGMKIGGNSVGATRIGYCLLKLDGPNPWTFTPSDYGTYSLQEITESQYNDPTLIDANISNITVYNSMSDIPMIGQ